MDYLIIIRCNIARLVMVRIGDTLKLWNYTMMVLGWVLVLWVEEALVLLSRLSSQAAWLIGWVVFLHKVLLSWNSWQCKISFHGLEKLQENCFFFIILENSWMLLNLSGERSLQHTCRVIQCQYNQAMNELHNHEFRPLGLWKFSFFALENCWNSSYMYKLLIVWSPLL